MAIARALLVAILVCAWSHARGDDEALDAQPALAAAEEWLAVVDARRYGESWENAAPLFRDALEKSRWEMLVDAARAPLGVAISRKLRSATFTRKLPNAPPGEYFVIQYDTRFATRPQSIEIVTPMRLPDGGWRVSGYIIR